MPKLDCLLFPRKPIKNCQKQKHLEKSDPTKWVRFLGEHLSLSINQANKFAMSETWLEKGFATGYLKAGKTQSQRTGLSHQLSKWKPREQHFLKSMGARTAYFLMGNINAQVSWSKTEVVNFENLTRKNVWFWFKCSDSYPGEKNPKTR